MRSSKTTTCAVKEGSGNVYADLGFADAKTLIIKADIVSRMGGIAKDRKLRNKDIAEIWNVDPSDVSHVMRGHFSGYTIDRLLKFLMAMEEDVEVVFQTQPKVNQDRS